MRHKTLCPKPKNTASHKFFGERVTMEFFLFGSKENKLLCIAYRKMMKKLIAVKILFVRFGAKKKLEQVHP